MGLYLSVSLSWLVCLLSAASNNPRATMSATFRRAILAQPIPRLQPFPDRILPAAGPGPGFQLGRPARLGRGARRLRLERGLAPLWGRHPLDAGVRHHLRTSGTSWSQALMHGAWSGSVAAYIVHPSTLVSCHVCDHDVNTPHAPLPFLSIHRIGRTMSRWASSRRR